MCAIVLGQCSDRIKGKLERQNDWENMSDDFNLVKILKNAKAWMLNQQGSKSQMMANYTPVIVLCRVRPNTFENNIDYRKHFAAAAQVLDHTEVYLERCSMKIIRSDLETNHGTTFESVIEQQITAVENGA